MSKKQKAVEAQIQAENLEKQNQITKGDAVKNVPAKDDKKKVKEKDKKKKEKKSKGGLGKKTKETVSELKKVTWPSFGDVVKKTGVVIAFVLIFGLFIYGVNTLLGYLAGLLA